MKLEVLNKRVWLCFALAVLQLGCASHAVAAPVGEVINARESGTSFVSGLERRIASGWKSNSTNKVDLSFTFDLSFDGAIYGLTLQKGFAEPLPIATAIHALVAGMPYVEERATGGTAPALGTALPRCTPRYQCSITGYANHPDIKVTQINAINDDVKQDLESITKVDAYKRQLFLNGPQYKRFVELLAYRYRHPDDANVKAELDTLLPYCGLDPKIAHHWIGYGRSQKARLKIEPLPKERVVAIADARLASLLETWRLDKRELLKLEIEHAYCERIASQLLSLPDLAPLLLGNAAYLTGQLNVAQEKYQIAAKENIDGAAAAMDHLKPPVSCEPITELVLNENYQPVSDGRSWKNLLNWLPLDTELLVVSRSESKAPDRDETPDPSEPMPMFLPVWPEYRELEVPGEPGLRAKDPNVCSRPIANVLCLHSARNFRDSNIDTCGVGTADAIDIVVFPKSIQGRLDAAICNLRERSTPSRVIKGVEVFGRSDLTYMGQSIFSDSGFFCQPVRGVLLFATDEISLTEVLDRLRTQPDNCAFPDSLPEWSYVDTTASEWGLRHYDTAYAPFDSRGMYDVVMASFYKEEKTKKESEYGGTEIGMTFSRDGKRLRQAHLSENRDTLEGLKKYWNGIYNYSQKTDTYNDTSNHGNPKITLENNVVTADGVPTYYAPVGIMLLVSMGYFVAI